MSMPDLLPEHAKPLEILHETRWMDALMNRSAPVALSVPRLSSAGAWRTSIAVRPEQIQTAEELVRRRYAWRGYRVPPADERSRDAPLRVVLLAQNAGQLMGTLTVRPDSPHGLLAETSYAGELQALRKRGHRISELCKLAVEEGADWRTALDALVQSAYLITHIVHAMTDVVIEVNPRHVRFYQRVFGFTRAAADRICERVGAPSALLCLDLQRFGRRLQLAA